jgi:pimeloyl-ACP methyl ester carboxylesterase
MQAARRLAERVDKLVLLEPSLFYLLQLHGCGEAFSEISALSGRMKRHALAATTEAAAEQFISYWAGPEAWSTSPADRRAVFAQAVSVVLHEWDAVLVGRTTREEWAAALPRHTLVISSATTTRPARELVEVLSKACSDWEFRRVPDGGHMAPLTHPDVVNPIIGAFLDHPGPGRCAGA